jgi:uncharacterized protein (DUF952 family)
MNDIPRCIYKLATESERNYFMESGSIRSALDSQDGFIHFSSNFWIRNVAKLFFSKVDDLYLLEVDVNSIPLELEWVCGKLGEAPPLEVLSSSKTVCHFLLPEGCVHIYGSVPISAIIREAHIPLVDDDHIFPEWLP